MQGRRRKQGSSYYYNIYENYYEYQYEYNYKVIYNSKMIILYMKMVVSSPTPKARKKLSKLRMPSGCECGGGLVWWCSNNIM
jgi:hypothetical protein